jgi:hypothetical protein
VLVRHRLIVALAGPRPAAVLAETVRNHLSSIPAELQVEDRSAAIVRAREAGLGR